MVEGIRPRRISATRRGYWSGWIGLRCSGGAAMRAGRGDGNGARRRWDFGRSLADLSGQGASGIQKEGGCTLYLGRDGVERELHVRPASGGVNGGERRWMPKMEPTGLFIAKGREDERAKVEDKLAKCCGRKMAAKELLHGRPAVVAEYGGMARMQGTSRTARVAAERGSSTRVVARGSWTAGTGGGAPKWRRRR